MSSFCANCGLQLSNDAALCPHHLIDTDDWAATNRIMCSYLHRNAPGRGHGVSDLPRVSRIEREGDRFVSYSECG